MSDDWQPGDLALCVNASPCPEFGDTGLSGGIIYSVREVLNDHGGSSALYGKGDVALRVVGVLHWFPFDAKRFRKIRPHTPDEEDRETIRLLNGETIPA
jgi:hypothetical protein